MKEFIKSAFDDIVILGLFKEHDSMFQTYLDANNDLRDDYRFGHTFGQRAKDMPGVKKSSVLVIHPEHLRSKFEPKHQSFRDETANQRITWNSIKTIKLFWLDTYNHIPKSDSQKDHLL